MAENKLIYEGREVCKADFDALYQGFLEQLAYLIRCSMEITNGYEAHYAKMHASPLFTASYPTCLENGGDVYCYNSTPYCHPQACI